MTTFLAFVALFSAFGLVGTISWMRSIDYKKPDYSEKPGWFLLVFICTLVFSLVILSHIFEQNAIDSFRGYQ